MTDEFNPLAVRPYQVMCIVCRMGSDGSSPYYFEERLDEMLAAVRRDRIAPIRLRCYSDSDFAYQNPGHEYDTPEGRLFNEKRDLEILRLLGLVPGDTRPAEELFNRLFERIPTCRGVCGWDEATSDAWSGCRLASSGNYERGIAKGTRQIFPPRDPEEKARVKKKSVAAMYEAARLRIRPHHLLCIACFHAGKEELAPIEEDNLFEAVDICQRNPETPVELIAGPCEICPPCSDYRPDISQCVKGVGGGLRDELRDLIVLQMLGLEYGDVLPARELYQRLFERVRSTRQVCGYNDGIAPVPEWRICGDPAGEGKYARARAVGMGIPGVTVDAATAD